MDIEGNISKFMSSRGPDRRYTSFDYCFNYFQAYRERDQIGEISARENMQLSCLHLGFYLASWGMVSRRSVLLAKSLKHYEPVLDVIATAPSTTWEIDAHAYTQEALAELMTVSHRIRQAFNHPNGASPTLVTKVMLGVFGNVPAFDTFVVAGLKASSLVGSFGIKALRDINRFYQEHHEVIERNREYTLDFDTGKLTDRRYTRAKVIDEIFFIEGGG
jgi:hypothetical protein